MPRAEAATRPTGLMRVPRWVAPVTMLLTLAGLAVATYLTMEHYTASITLACPETGVINCQKVTTSAQSTILGIPVAVLGLVFFAVMLPTCLPAAWRSPHPALRWGRVIFALTGIGFVVYLLYAELFVLNAICLWCTTVHAITITLFALIAFATASMEPDSQQV